MAELSNTVELIEQAATSLSQNQNIEESMALMRQWEESENSIFSACEVLQKSQNPYARFYACTILNHKIPVLWKNVNQENRQNFRNFILQQIELSGNNKQILDSLVRSLAHIAVFDFPEEWEGYEAYLFPENESFVTFLMLEAFFTDVEESEYITEHRRQLLRSNLSSKIDFFLPRIETAIRVEETAMQAMQAFSAMVKWAPRSAIKRDTLTIICSTFLPAEMTLQISVNCLKRIFLRRTDSHAIFAHYHELLLDAFANVRLPSGQSITSQYLVIKLVSKLFSRYMMNLEKWSVHRNNEKLKGNITSLLTICLSLRDDIPNSLWLTFFDIFKRIVDQNLGTMPTKYTKMLFDPMIPLIRSNLYEMLPIGVDDDGILMLIVQKCFAMLVEVDYMGMLEFIEHQNPSAALGYALGCLMSVRAPQQDMTSFVQIIQQLNDESQNQLNQDDGSEFLIPVLYGLSRSAFFLSSMDLFDNFFEMTISCLQSSIPQLKSAATHALLYVAMNHSNLFEPTPEEIAVVPPMSLDGSILPNPETASQQQRAEENQINMNLNILVQMSEQYLNGLSLDGAIRMFHVVNILLVKMKKNLFEMLYTPVVAALNSSSGPAVESALILIGKSSTDKVNELNKKNEKLPAGTFFAPLLLPQVVQLASRCIPQQVTPPDVVEVILNTLSSLIYCYNDFALIDNIIRGILSLFVQREEIFPSYFNFIAAVRNKFSEMNNFYEEIMQRFVYSIIPTDFTEIPSNAPLSEILMMISRFKYAPTNIEWVVKVVMGTGIPSLEKDINVASSKLIIRVFREMETETLRQMFGSVGTQIFAVILTALSDSMHKQAFNAYTKVIWKMCKLLTIGLEFPKELSELLVLSLQNVFEEPREGLFKEFVSYLAQTITDCNAYAEGIANFLIMMNKLSPGDASVFDYVKDIPFIDGYVSRLSNLIPFF
ncbi:hypothetical protein TRFO_16061 [Tritrichomonas foetus]|uniref:Importin N-terminal domain-containing protein n=1 Tax=Tritrichomonas foetus TaxID=1144522 RepID=A0A1J4KS77_9EUKA|nr:hypothetical protein TRFO_16061 [Tritrichomonas foetus]|eukprot:OHT13736.1 hypothetical protein TRFO_16061 [Tritrichomonas foetus]